MATSLTPKIDVTLSWVFTNTPTGSRAVNDTNQVQVRKSLSDGTTLDKADRKFDARRTIVAAANDDLDLAGSLLDAFGNTITFAKVKGIIIYNRQTEAGRILTVGGGANPFADWLGAAGDLIKIGPEGLFVLWNPSLAGYAVTAGTGDILRLNATGGDIVYDIAIIGTSA